jgi:3',5'-cyclic AMP phosphodiesterase CpdA
MNLKKIFVLFLVFVSLITIAEIVKSDDVSRWAEENSKDKFSFVIFGDSRPVYANAPLPEAFLKRVFREISWIDPDFIVHLGDIIYGFYEGPERILKEYEDFLNIYRSTVNNVPMLVIPANHELQPSEYSFKKFKELFGNLMYYDFFYGNSHFVVINGNFPSSLRGNRPKYGFYNINDGYHKLGMIDWLREKLTEKAEHTFVLSHVPMFSIEGEGKYKNADDEVMRIVDGVDALFTAHRHFTYVSSTGKTDLFILGGGGAPLDRDVCAKGPEGVFSYLLVEVDGEDVEYKLLVPFSVDVVREENTVYVINRSTYTLTFKGVKLRTKKIKAFRLGEKIISFIPPKVSLREENGEVFATVKVPPHAAVVIKEEGM